LEKPFVLVVDDNEATCTLITALLQKEFTVEVAADGNEAIEKLRTKNYTAIILDLLMPQLDGYGVLDWIRENQPEVRNRVLVVSAALSRTENARVSTYGVCKVISKPFEVETILSAVRDCAAAGHGRRGPYIASGMILLLADLLQRRVL
jgi:CheY-like chemotaxis protein